MKLENWADVFKFYSVLGKNSSKSMMSGLFPPILNQDVFFLFWISECTFIIQA